MDNCREHGNPPYTVAVIHGGPGACGGLGAVAREIAGYSGCLEPIQTARTLNGQVEELCHVLRQKADIPVTLVGFSWGAWLSVITAARYPEIAQKLILVGSGPFTEEFAAKVTLERLNRLTETDRQRALELAKNLDNARENAGELFDLFHDIDTYERIEDGDEPDEPAGFDYAIYRGVWPEAERIRSNGALLEYARTIESPVVAIHGDSDPHPAEGVRKPLSGALNDFRFVLLERCGHDPQIEKYARDRFYAILKEEITRSV